MHEHDTQADIEAGNPFDGMDPEEAYYVLRTEQLDRGLAGFMSMDDVDEAYENYLAHRAYSEEK